MSSDTFKNIAILQGWSTNRKVEILLDYLSSHGHDAEFNNFVEQLANQDNAQKIEETRDLSVFKIPVLFQANDYTIEAGVDAELWFTQAFDEHILEFAKSKFCDGDIFGDFAAFFEANDPLVERVLEHSLNSTDFDEEIGFTCFVEIHSILGWIKHNRPHLFAEAVESSSQNLDEMNTKITENETLSSIQ